MRHLHRRRSTYLSMPEEAGEASALASHHFTSALAPEEEEEAGEAFALVPHCSAFSSSSLLVVSDADASSTSPSSFGVDADAE